MRKIRQVDLKSIAYVAIAAAGCTVGKIFKKHLQLARYPGG